MALWIIVLNFARLKTGQSIAGYPVAFFSATLAASAAVVTQFMPFIGKEQAKPMIRAIIFSALAILSLTLSYFYEVKPAKSAEIPSTSIGFKITPYAINSGEDVVRALELNEPLEGNSATEEFFSKRLNMHFTKPENWQLAETVARWIGTPYSYGRNSRKGTDCSGFVTSIYREVYGIKLSRSSHSMFSDVQRIKRDELQTGDLVFFRRSPKQPIFHVGIYLKNNKFIHSAINGGVMVSSLKEPYYRNYFYAAGRVN